GTRLAYGRCGTGTPGRGTGQSLSGCEESRLDLRWTAGHGGTMVDSSNWAFPPKLQPRAQDLPFDLDAAMRSVVLVHTEVPEDAFTASIMGTERVGHGAVIGADGLVLTIGYLITEAESVWLTTH